MCLGRPGNQNCSFTNVFPKAGDAGPAFHVVFLKARNANPLFYRVFLIIIYGRARDLPGLGFTQPLGGGSGTGCHSRRGERLQV